MTIEQTKKLYNHIFRLLKVAEIVIPIGRTSKGNLGIKFNQNSEDFEIMLDSVPLSTKDMLADDNNIELKKMLEKYLFESKNDTFSVKHVIPHLSMEGASITGNTLTLSEKKKRGRPAKVK